MDVFIVKIDEELTPEEIDEIISEYVARGEGRWRGDVNIQVMQIT